MRLTELEPRFVRYEIGTASEGHGRHLADGSIQWGGFPVETILTVETLAEAHGIRFLCPVCFKANNGPIGTHGVEVTFADRGAADAQGSRDSNGAPSRWQVSGNVFEDLTTQPSIHLAGPGCGWHGFVTNGEAT